MMRFSVSEKIVVLKGKTTEKLKAAEETINKKVQEVRIDNSLEKYKNKPVFQEKLDKANEVLKRVGPPKIKIK